MRRDRKRTLRRLAVLYFVASTLMLVWPIYPWLGNHVEPRVVGLPWSFAYVLGVVFANFVVLAWLHAARVVDDPPSFNEGDRG